MKCEQRQSCNSPTTFPTHAFARQENSRRVWMQVAGAATLLCLFAGCPSVPEEPTSDPQSTQPIALNVLVVDDHPMALAMQRFWQAEGNGEVQLTEWTSEQLVTQEFRLPKETDVVVFPAPFVGELFRVNSVLPLPLDRLEQADFNKTNVFTHLRSELTQFRRETQAVPLGIPQLVLFYREDVLQQAELAVPQTWAELREACQILSQKIEQGEIPGVSHTILEPTSQDWAAHLFLARAASRIRNAGRISTVIDLETGQPLIDGEPFVSVLQEMVESNRGATGATDGTPESVFREMLAGRSIFAITWPSQHFPAERGEASNSIRIARLPGNPAWYDPSAGTWMERDRAGQQLFDYVGFDGRLAAVAKNSLNAGEAIRFVAWLSSFTTSRKVSVESTATAPFRFNHLGNITTWTGDVISDAAATDYFDAMAASHRDRLCFIFPRLRDQAAYLSALAESVHQALSGELSAEEALQGAAARWRALNERYGVEEQRRLILDGENL